MPAKRKPSKRSPKPAPAPKVKRRRGRPDFLPTKEQRELVKTLAAYRIPQDEMALQVINPGTGRPISETTLKSAFQEDIQIGYATGRVRLIAATMQSALGVVETVTEGGQVVRRVTKDGNITAQIWLGKSLYGMREAEAPAGAVKDHAMAIAADIPDEDKQQIDDARRVAFVMARGALLLKKAKGT